MSYISTYESGIRFIDEAIQTEKTTEIQDL